jgi:hypothetical protein
MIGQGETEKRLVRDFAQLKYIKDFSDKQGWKKGITHT